MIKGNVKGKLQTERNSTNSSQKRVYRILPSFDSSCSNCSLSCTKAIGGHSFSGLSNVNLIIVASYPARDEIQKGYSLAPNAKVENIDKPNAGRYLHYSTIFHFDWDSLFPAELKPFYDRIAFTNMIKCSPFNSKGEKLDVKDTHIKSCKSTWLEKEIHAISQYNPTCPILLCGSEAAKLLHPKQKVYSGRRKVFMYNNTHPTVITFNPVEIVRYTANTISSSKTNTKGKLLVEKVSPLKPIIVGSPTWHWTRDMELIKTLVIKNYNEINTLN